MTDRVLPLDKGLVLRPEAPAWREPVFRPLFLVNDRRRIEHRVRSDFESSAIETLWGVMYLWSGEARLRLDERRYTLTPGWCALIRSPARGSLTVVPTREPLNMFGITFIGGLAEQYCESMYQRFGAMHRIGLDNRTFRRSRRLLRMAREQIRRPDHVWSEATFDWLQAWRHDAEASNPRVAEFVEHPQASRLLEANVSTVTSFAERLGYSRSHLSGRLTELWNDSPGKLLREARLRNAERLLRETELDVAAIAQRVGYTAAASFSRAFKAKYGQPPSKYRRSDR